LSEALEMDVSLYPSDQKMNWTVVNMK
jgi:hypothetical protein